MGEDVDAEIDAGVDDDAEFDAGEDDDADIDAGEDDDAEVDADTLRPFHFSDGKKFLMNEGNSSRKSDNSKEEINFLFKKQRNISTVALLSGSSR